MFHLWTLGSKFVLGEYDSFYCPVGLRRSFSALGSLQSQTSQERQIIQCSGCFFLSVWLLLCNITRWLLWELLDNSRGIFASHWRFALCNLVELLAEPAFLIAQFRLLVSVRVRVEGFGMIAKCFHLFAVVHLPKRCDAVCLDQLVSPYRLWYCTIFISLSECGTSFFPKTLALFENQGESVTNRLSLTWRFMTVSLVKFVLTEGEKYVMVFIQRDAYNQGVNTVWSKSRLSCSEILCSIRSRNLPSQNLVYSALSRPKRESWRNANQGRSDAGASQTGYLNRFGFNIFWSKLFVCCHRHSVRTSMELEWRRWARVVLWLFTDFGYQRYHRSSCFLQFLSLLTGPFNYFLTLYMFASRRCVHISTSAPLGSLGLLAANGMNMVARIFTALSLFYSFFEGSPSVRFPLKVDASVSYL